MSNETKEMIIGYAIISLSAIGVYAICKEIKDAYYKHKMLKSGKALEEIGRRLNERHNNVTESKEESL